MQVECQVTSSYLGFISIHNVNMLSCAPLQDSTAIIIPTQLWSTDKLTELFYLVFLFKEDVCIQITTNYRVLRFSSSLPNVARPALLNFGPHMKSKKICGTIG